MSLEVATYISELISTNPVGAVDDYATADDHLRLIKSVLQNNFPNFAAAAINPTDVELNLLVGLLATSAELNNLDGYTGNTADLNVLSGAAAGGLTAAELLYVADVTSLIQAQLDLKATEAITVTGSNGVAGGGDLSTNRVLNLDITGLSTLAAPAAADAIGVYDDDAATNKQLALSALQAFIDANSTLTHDGFADFVANEHINHGSVSLLAGTGISASGLGNLTANRTINALAATESAVGVVERATQAEAEAGTDNTRYMSPLRVEQAIADSSAGDVQLKVKTADESVTSSTTMQDDNHLNGFVLEADTQYILESCIIYLQNVGNYQQAYTFTNSPQSFFSRMLEWSTDTGGNTEGGTTVLTTQYAVTTMTDNQYTAHIHHGFFKAHATTGGTMKLRWTQQTNSANSTTLIAGSWVRITKAP